MIATVFAASAGTIVSVLAYSIRNARKPAGKPDMVQVWHEGGPL